MSIPETTSAEAFERYVGGRCLAVGRGEAWRNVKAWIVALPLTVDTLYLPSVSEPFLAWTMSGEVDFQERENGQPWVTHRIKKGSFFLTSGGAPYECRWKAVTSEPFESMAVFIELPLLQLALEEVYGADAKVDLYGTALVLEEFGKTIARGGAAALRERGVPPDDD